MDQHHAEVDGETVGQVVPSIRLLAIQPDGRRLLFGSQSIHQIDLRPAVLREAGRDLEHLAVARVGMQKSGELVLEVGCTSGGLRLRSIEVRVGFLPLRSPVLQGRVFLQVRQAADLHATYRELLA